MSRTTMSKSKLVRDISKKSVIDLSETIYKLSPHQFCSKKLLEIELAIPRTTQDRQVLDEIIEAGKKYEHISGAHFITYEDVIDFIDKLIQRSDDIELSERVKEYAREMLVLKFQELDSLPLNLLALMTKLKLVEKMRNIYTSEVKKMQRRHQVREELTGLIKESVSPSQRITPIKSEEIENPMKKNKISGSNLKLVKNESITQRLKASVASIRWRSKSQLIFEEMETPTLEENDLIFDYNVDDHAMYFVLCGFPDILILQDLAKLYVPISAVIEISVDSSNDKEVENYIEKLQDLYESPKETDYLEDTVWMKCRINEEDSSKDQFETFLYVVRKINYIKRQHMAYIKDLKLWSPGTIQKNVDVKCLEKYNKILNSYPSDLINIPLIISALIDEVCWRGTGPIYSLSDLTPSSETADVVWKEPKSYQTHEEDFLKMNMKAYGDTGQKCYDDSLALLNRLEPLNKKDHPLDIQYESRAVLTEADCCCDHRKELFDYFHLSIFNLMRRDESVPRTPKKSYFTKYLVTDDPAETYRKALPTGYVEYREEENNFFHSYHLKEDLSTSVLRQLVFKAMKQYSCWDRIYCSESEAFLLRFHDNLNGFGLSTKTWRQNLRTPVCLRDFCRFVANEEKKWLETHKLVEHEFMFTNKKEDKCKGLRDIHISEMYKEYEYLLESGAQEMTVEEKKKIFDQVLSELVDYPTSKDLTYLCDKDGSFLAYNLGPKLCQLTGHTTIFHSDDGVKVTIDNSRFMTQDPRCAITVDSGDNSLVFHSTRPSSFHFICKDETLVSFTEFETSSIDVSSFFSPKEEIVKSEESTEDGLEQQSEDQILQQTNYNNYSIQVLRKSKIAPINFQRSIYDKKIDLDDVNLGKLLELFKTAVTTQKPIYMISTKPSLRFLKRTTSPINFPLASVLKRVLFKRRRKKRKLGSYSVLNISKMKQKIPLKYDFKITLPNGLRISTLPRTKKLAEVKQEYTHGHYKEQYRLMYSSGVIVIKNFDGTITILRANGDIIKLTDQSGCSSTNCAKNTTKLFQNNENDFCPYETSRHDHMTKSVQIPDLYEFGNIPYNKKSLLQFDGKLIDISDEKVTERQLHYVLSEHDYHAEEVFFEREDGMKCIVDRRGTQVYQFPDGTKITAYPEIEKELIYVSNNPKVEGWVSVVTNYKFEHPDYLTVGYDESKGTTQIFFRDAVVTNSDDSFTMCIENLKLHVTSESLDFSKTCSFCESDCVCKIHLNQGPKLLEVTDSYGKHLSCDHFGKCQINYDFVKTAQNKKNCDHRWWNEKQKFFILNEHGAPGTLLWKDSSIESKINAVAKNKDVKVMNYMNKLTKKQTLEFYTKVCQNFIGRFTMTSINRDICLSKYKIDVAEPRLRYVTFRILTEFQNLAEHPKLIEELKEFLERRPHVTTLTKGLQRLLSITSHHERHEEKLSFQLSITQSEESGSSSSVATALDMDRISVNDIIAKWKEECDKYRYLIRNKKFPPYFKSEFYAQLKKSSD